MKNEPARSKKQKTTMFKMCSTVRAVKCPSSNVDLEFRLTCQLNKATSMMDQHTLHTATLMQMSLAVTKPNFVQLPSNMFYNVERIPIHEINRRVPLINYCTSVDRKLCKLKKKTDEERCKNSLCDWKSDENLSYKSLVSLQSRNGLHVRSMSAL